MLENFLLTVKLDEKFFFFVQWSANVWNDDVDDTLGKMINAKSMILLGKSLLDFHPYDV